MNHKSLSNKTAASRKLIEIYDRLYTTYGPQHWWPAESPFEVMVGAILTQSAAWKNVEKAIANLKSAQALSPAALLQLDSTALAALVRPSGYYNAKIRKLKAMAEWIGKNYGDDIAKMSAQNTAQLREQLLGVHGIGPETADSIILYAANQPIFVIDAYTRRILDRIGIVPDAPTYTDYQALFMNNLPLDSTIFNEYHALLVQLGKEACRKRPVCEQCCLKDLCKFRNTPIP
jgi:endonuclease III related protein